MTLGKGLLPEFDMEMAGTRKVLERVPADKFDWKIHDKSQSIGGVATHLANLPTWATMTLQSSSLDVMPKDGEPFTMPQFESPAAMLEAFDQNVQQARSLLDSVSDEEILQPWTLLKTGETIFTMPRLAVIRTWVINHIIHHRGHLCVYLRVNDIPVPALYGPSADEQ